jgi:hypothetical protein
MVPRVFYWYSHSSSYEENLSTMYERRNIFVRNWRYGFSPVPLSQEPFLEEITGEY